MKPLEILNLGANPVATYQGLCSIPCENSQEKVWTVEENLWREPKITRHPDLLRSAVDNSADKWGGLLITPPDHNRDRRGPGAALLAMLLALGAAAGCKGRDEQAAPAAAGPVRRVVTTTPSSTELVAAAGGADRIVGVDRFSDYPPRVVGLPIVGDFM